MSFADNYFSLRKKKNELEKKKTITPSNTAFEKEYLSLAAERDDDIAPVRTVTTPSSYSTKTTQSQKEDEEDGGLQFFKKSSLFEDGYDVGDVTKTILGTTFDAVVNVSKGVTRLVEGVADAGAYGVAAVGGALGADDFSERTKAWAKESKTDDIWGFASDAVSEHSVLGRSSDSVTEGIGQVAAILATGGLAGAAGAGTGLTTAITTGLTGVSGLGSGMSEAYQSGATDEEAATYGIISGGSEALTELLFGGLGKAVGAVGLSKGISSADDLLAKKVSNLFSNQIAKNVAEYGIKASAEGLEEVIAGTAQAIGKWKTYKSEEELRDIINDENLLEQFVVGAVTSGIAQSGIVPGMKSGSLIEANKTGRDFVTGFTQDEQTVIDKVVEQQIAEAEKDGTTLTKKQKGDIQKQVESDLDKGYISIDTIEETLGGDDYKTYKDTITNEDAQIKSLEEQIKELEDSPNTVGNSKKYDALTEQLDELKANSQRDQLRKRLDDAMAVKMQDSRLAESYNEKARRGQTFEADVSKYDAKQQAVVQKAIDSGILNNTNRTHEFVDMIAKISADKGVSFDFTNNAKLKESGYAVDGATINGFVTKDGITLNIDSSKATRSVAGHEITHILEGTELYTELQNTIFEYAKSKGEYDSRLAAISKLYENVEGADVNAELTADLVGDYLFTDADFINNLSTKHRNIFEKIYDEIKYLCKVATAGSKEARELEKVKKAFEDAYRVNGNAQKNTATEDGVKFALESKTQPGRLDPRTVTKNDVMELLSKVDEGSIYGNTYIPVRINTPSTLIYWAEKRRGDVIDNNPIAMSADKAYNAMNRDGETESGRVNRLSAGEVIAVLEAMNDPEYIVYQGSNDRYVEVVKFSTKKGDRAFAVIEIGNNKDAVYMNGYEGGLYNIFVTTYPPKAGKLNELLNNANNQVIYDKKKDASQRTSSSTVPSVLNDASFYEDSLPYNPNGVKGNVQYSLTDNTGKELSKGQQDYFKDSKMRDDDGNLMVMYHGSQDAGFHEFDGRFSDDDVSFFFVDRNDVAASYSGTTETYEAKTIRTVEDMNNFLAEIGYDQYEAVESNGKFELLENGDHVAYSDTAQGIYDEFCWYESVGEGDANYKVYLNLTNPLVVDGKGRPWNKIDAEFSQEMYDKYNSLTAEEKAALTDLAEWEDFQLFNSEIQEATNGALASAFAKLDEDYVNIYDLFSVAADNFSEESMRENARNYLKTRDYAQRAHEQGYDGVIFKNIVDNGGYSNGSEGASTVAIAFDSKQIKSTANVNPTEDADIRYSLSNNGETHRYARGDGPMSDLRYIAPVQEDVAPVQDSVQDVAPTKPLTADDMIGAIWDAEFKMKGNTNAEADAPATAEDAESAARMRLARITSNEAPPEAEAPYYGESEPATAADPFEDRPWWKVDRNTKAFTYENPDARPFFAEEAGVMLGDLSLTTKGERIYNDELYYATNGEKGYTGIKRHTSDDIAQLLDDYGLSYDDIETGLNAIIEGNNKLNNKAAKHIEYIINDRLLKGYKDFYTGEFVPPNQEYIEWLNERQHNAEYGESFAAITDADAPISEEIADVAPIAPTAESKTVEDVMPIADAPIAYEAIKPKAEQEPRMAKATPAEQARAQVLTEEPNEGKKKNGLLAKAKNAVLDKGMVFEDLSLKTGNRELQAKWNSIRYADGKAQKQIGESLKPIRDAVEKTGKTQQFYEYLYHQHNVDRMTLAERFPDMENKPVFGDSVTARESRAIIAELVRKNPEFKQYAQEVYDYNTDLRELLVEGGVISRETANLWEKMYPHYVPIRRAGDTGLNINVPLDTGRTGVNAPIKRATGGSRDILPLFDTMGQRTIQTYKAIAKNRFGVELKNTLGTTVGSDAVGVDETIDSIDAQDGLLQEGKNGKNPTFTVFENGEKVTFEITEEMYDSMKPTSAGLATTIKPLNVASNIFRGLTTEYNPTFIFTNPIKDVQDVLINSQHPARTYFAIPKAIKEMATNGRWYQEYVSNGGEQNTYFDNQTNTFEKEKSGLAKVLGLPLEGISKANNFIEMMPRLAEYIVSRQMKRSIDVAMLDAARVTTNFAAGGDLTKWANRNGATFLNASVQGAVQQVRNIREAKANGLKGVLTLAAKFGVAGLTASVLNGLLWGDDDEYEELSDYVKQNYYIVGKFDDGKFVRIPKGRTVAVIQDGLEQMQHLVTGDDEADLKAFGELLINNLAPNNPLENNIFAPIMQVASNKTWYGEDLVPTRLQDVPAAEQYDESTDSISKWLGEKTNTSPYKWNYLLNQYGGGAADTFLPMLTPEAESGDNSRVGNLLAPFKSKFTTDAVMNNQNVSDFYDTVDELAVNANASGATDEDSLKYKYMNSVNAEMGELYQLKREIQNGDLTDAEKYAIVRDIQRDIDELAEEALNTYENVNITGNYASVGDRQYRWYEPSEDSDAEAGWQKLTDKQVEKQDEVTSGLGITPSEYWDNKEEYDYAYENPGKYAIAKSVGGYQDYRFYSSELYDITADKDENGNSISGSAKEKKMAYIEGLDLDYGQKIILHRSLYDSKADKAKYNLAIVEYLDSREDISWDEMKTILEELDFTVYDDGRITW